MLDRTDGEFEGLVIARPIGAERQRQIEVEAFAVAVAALVGKAQVMRISECRIWACRSSA